MDKSGDPIHPGIEVEDVLPAALPIEVVAVLPASPPTLPPIHPPLPSVQPTKEKCKAKCCPGLHLSPHTPLTNCCAEECAKLVPQICYEKLLLKWKKPRTEPPTAVFCTFFCRTSTESPIPQTIFIGGMMEKMDQRTRSTPIISSSNCYLPATTISHGWHPLPATWRSRFRKVLQVFSTTSQMVCAAPMIGAVDPRWE